MAEGGVDLEILQEPHFKRLAASDTSAEEFTRLVAEHVPGYLCKKRLVDGLKALLAKVEAAENKLYLAKNLGKAKGKLEPEQQALVDHHGSPDLKEKIQSLNADMQAMIDEGRITLEERPQIQEQLSARREAAKTAEKAKLVEKLEKMLVSVARAQLTVLPIPNLEEIYPMHLELKDILRLEKRPAKNLSAEERGMLPKKAELQETIRKWSESNRMWFETEDEFAPRRDKALESLMQSKAEQRKREEEEALERKRLAEEQALEKKRLEKQQAEEQKAKELEAKLEAKRLEAAAKPQKAAPQPKKKEKVQRTKLDNKDLFAPPPRGEDEPPEDAHEAHDGGHDSHEEAESGGAHSEAEEEEPRVVAPETARAPEKATPAKAAAKAKAVRESLWDAPAAPIAQEGAPEEAGPSLSDAKAAPVVKKTPPPAPKKKEKKKFQKLDATQLGFDANNPNYLN